MYKLTWKCWVLFRPRKRVVLDWDPVLKRISAQVIVRNRSQEAFAFKVICYFDGNFKHLPKIKTIFYKRTIVFKYLCVIRCYL